MAIRVLHVIDHLGFGGAPVYVRGLVENINTSRVENFVCALRTNPDAMPIKARVISLEYHRYDPRTILAVARLCRQYEIDILHAHLHKSIASCLLASFICKGLVLVQEHGDVFQRGLTFSIYRLLLRLLRRRASAIIANSLTAACQLVQKRVDKGCIYVVPNAVDFSIFDPARVSRKVIRDRMGISDGDFVLGFVGRLHYVKGADLLIEALSLLLRKSQQYLLLVAGDGPQQQSLKALAKRPGVEARVRFLGTCDNVSELMAAFDVGVVPSRRESFGITVLELMRMKIPVVASGVDGMAELVTNGTTALVTGENTPEEIARCVERLTGDGELRKRLTEAAYSFSDRFGLSEHVKGIERIYERVVQSTAG